MDHVSMPDQEFPRIPRPQCIEVCLSAVETLRKERADNRQVVDPCRDRQAAVQPIVVSSTLAGAGGARPAERTCSSRSRSVVASPRPGGQRWRWTKPTTVCSSTSPTASPRRPSQCPNFAATRTFSATVAGEYPFSVSVSANVSSCGPRGPAHSRCHSRKSLCIRGMYPPSAQWPEGDDDALVMPSLQAHLPRKSPVIERDR